MKVSVGGVAAVLLIWAFFSIPAVQNAVSGANRWLFLEQKARQLESTNRLLEEKIAELQKENEELASRAPLPAHQERSRLEEMEKLAEKVKQTLLEVTPENSFEMEHSENGIIVRIWQDTLFTPDSTYTHGQGRIILEKIMSALKDLNQNASLDVEGHSDAQPLRASMQNRFETNREMSASRAVNVSQIFERAGFLPAQKICAMGWGSAKPMVSENTAEALAKNRRIELIFSWESDFLIPKNN
ncbi:MAG: OmpA/MotB family protein [Verrucomicrobiota bacterium]